MILRLSEAGALEAWASPQVLGEIEAVIRRKAPEALGTLTVLLHQSRVRVCGNSSAQVMKRCEMLIGHPGDCKILAEAWTANVDYFVTLDQQHFLGNAALRKAVPFAVGTPGDFLSWYRNRLIEL